MRITIVTEDKLIGINGEFLSDIEEDMTWIPNDVHAVQWYHDHGEIEYTDNRPNLEIESLGLYSKCINTFNSEKERRERKCIQEELEYELTRDYWGEFRMIRDYLLNESDWVLLPDAPISEEKKELWIQYRQELRDFPSIVEDPKPYANDIDRELWPQKPI
jgi:hypothetical protein